MKRSLSLLAVCWLQLTGLDLDFTPVYVRADAVVYVEGFHKEDWVHSNVGLNTKQSVTVRESPTLVLIQLEKCK